MNSMYVISISARGKTLFRTHHNRWTYAASYSSLHITFCTFWKLVSYCSFWIETQFLLLHIYIRLLEAGTSFHYWSTEKRHNNLPTLLPSLRQHPSPFRQAGEFIRTKFWKIFEVKAKEKGRLYYLGRFCLIIDLLFTVCLGMLIINFGSRCSRTFVIRSVDRPKLIFVNFTSMTVPHRSATTLRRWRTATAPVMGGVCCQTVRRQTGAKTPRRSCSWRVCLSEWSRRTKDSYIQFCYGYMAVYVVSTSLIAYQDRCTGIQISSFSLAQYVGHWLFLRLTDSSAHHKKAPWMGYVQPNSPTKTLMKDPHDTSHQCRGRRHPHCVTIVRLVTCAAIGNW